MTKTVLLIFFLALLVFPATSLASFFYLTPAASQADSDSKIDLKLGLNTAGESVNALTADLVYSDDKLTLDSIDYNPLAFQIGAEDIRGGGKLIISRGSIFGVNGDVTVATLKFKTKNNGTAQLAFTPDSVAAKTSDSTNSFDLSKSQGASIVIGSLAQASPSTNALPSTSSSVNSTPTPGNNNNFTPEQLIKCQEQKTQLKNRFNSTIGLADAIGLRIGRIDNLVQNYYLQQLLPQKRQIPNFISLQKEIQSKKQSVSGQISDLKSNVDKFSCEDQPIFSLTNIKNKFQELKKGLVEYQTAEKKLLTAVKKVSQK